MCGIGPMNEVTRSTVRREVSDPRKSFDDPNRE